MANNNWRQVPGFDLVHHILLDYFLSHHVNRKECMHAHEPKCKHTCTHPHTHARKQTCTRHVHTHLINYNDKNLFGVNFNF